MVSLTSGPIAALSLIFFLLSLAQPSLASWPLTARHDDDGHDHDHDHDHSHSGDHDHSRGGHNSTDDQGIGHGHNSTDHDHSSSGHHSTDNQGAGHGHSMSHGAFNFTPSGIPWPTCPRECCNQFFVFFPEPVNHALCVSEEFYHNVTQCVAETCTPYEQGAYAVVAEIECPADDSYAGEEVRALLKGFEGDPQVCEGVENRTIVCENETVTVTGEEAAEPTATGMAARVGLERVGTLVWGVVFLGAFGLFL
jgi:hypothetical protein